MVSAMREVDLGCFSVTEEELVIDWAAGGYGKFLGGDDG